MPARPIIQFTELSLTLGNWGRAPLSIDRQRQVLQTLANWSSRTGVAVRPEVYARPESQRGLIEEWAGRDELKLLVREEPRSDRFERIAEMGARHVVIDVPVSPQAAAVRFRPHGSQQAVEFAATVARGAILHGLAPEIALIDIARAEKFDVLLLVDKVLDTLRPHDALDRLHWRLVDSTGWGDPLAGGRLPRSLPAWLRLLEKEFEIPADHVTVQSADTLGLGLANSLAGVNAGAHPATTLFGLGMGAGWAATDLVLAHTLGVHAQTKKLLGLRHVILGDLADQPSASFFRDPHRPLSGANAWQFAGGASPEKPSPELLEAHFPLPAKQLVRHDPEPLLTALSGHAGLLHLMHREWPELHFETDDDRALAISRVFEEEFANGRQIPVSWAELRPKVIAAGLVE